MSDGRCRDRVSSTKNAQPLVPKAHDHPVRLRLCFYGPPLGTQSDRRTHSAGDGGRSIDIIELWTQSASRQCSMEPESPNQYNHLRSIDGERFSLAVAVLLLPPETHMPFPYPGGPFPVTVEQ